MDTNSPSGPQIIWVGDDGVVLMFMPDGLQICELGFLDWEPMSLELARGEIVGVSGASGSGKSLLLRAVADLDMHVGEVFLRGSGCSTMPAPEWRRRVAMLPAESRWWHLTVGEHFVSDCVQLVEDLGFGEDVFDWEISRLSAGERQRLALARLLAREPEVLLLDEPTANLDEVSTRMVEAVVCKSGLATIWVSHEQAQLERVAQRRFRIVEKRLEEIR